MSESNATLPSVPPDDGQRRGNAMLITETLFVAIGTVLVLVRFYVRAYIKRKVGLDDAFILPGLICSIIFCFCSGLGRRDYSLALSQQSLPELLQAMKWIYIGQPMVIASTMFTKISICIFLLRAFGIKKTWRWILYSVMFFSTATNICSAAIAFTMCQPFQKLWKPLLPGMCWTPHTAADVGYYNGAVSVFCDWSLASLPILFTWELQISRRLKMTICVLMGMGFFSGICAIVRTKALGEFNDEDISWNFVDLTIWASLEANVGIIAACIPTLKPLFDPATRPIWFHGGWSRKLTSDSGYRHNNAERNHQNNQIDLENLPRPATAMLSGHRNVTNLIEISGGRKSSTSDESNSRLVGGGENGSDNAIRKMTEFTLQSVPFHEERPTNDGHFK